MKEKAYNPMTAEELMNRLDIDGPDMPAFCEALRKWKGKGR